MVRFGKSLIFRTSLIALCRWSIEFNAKAYE